MCIRDRYIARSVRQGMEETDLLPQLTAAVTRFDGMDYRSITSEAGGEEKELRRVDEGTEIPSTTVKVQENLVKLHKRGRMLVASYEAIRFQRLDLFSVTLRQIGAYIARMHLKDAIDVLMNGDGNNNAADAYEIGSGSGKISGTAACPRLSVYRSLSNISAQLIDDKTGVTLAAASSYEKGFEYGGNKEAAKQVGKLIAERAAKAGITEIVFDRGGNIYHCLLYTSPSPRDS